MAFLSEKDAKVVGDRLGKLAKPVMLAVFTQEFECDYCPGNAGAGGRAGCAFRRQAHRGSA